MTTELLPSTDDIASRSLEVAVGGGRVYVEGPVGAGRNSLLAKLVHLDARAVVLELLPLADADAPAVALMELAAQTGSASDVWPEWSSGTEEELHSLALAAGQRLADAKRVLVIRMPDNWTAAEGARSTPDAQPSRARSLLSGLFRSAAAVVLIADSAVTPSLLGFHGRMRLQLPPHSRPPGALESANWGDYRDAFREIASALNEVVASPLAWRLAVGSRALGAPLETVAAHLRATLPLQKLAATLTEQLESHEELQRAVRRFMAIRRPVPRAQAADLSGIPAQHQSLILECVGYGDRETRVSTVLRTLLGGRLGSAEEQAHARFADHYAGADGAPSPIGLDGKSLRAWCEKAHHLAHAGSSGSRRWAELDLVAPSLYWDRGRYLSQEARDYRSAAEVYAKCVERFPADDYAWHYLAFNRQRSGESGEPVLAAYREAVSLNPEHPWWNGRLVTTLIDSGLFDAAEREWRATIERVDPDGTQVCATDWLARHLHRWVCGAWLKAGKPEQARAVLDLVPKRLTTRGPLGVLQERVQAGVLQSRWDEFLRDLEARCGLSASHAESGRRWWAALQQVEPALPLPAAHRTSEGALQFAWSYASLLLEFDMAADGEAYWFGRDRESGAFEDGTATLESVPDALEPWLERTADA